MLFSDTQPAWSEHLLGWSVPLPDTADAEPTSAVRPEVTLLRTSAAERHPSVAELGAMLGSSEMP